MPKISVNNPVAERERVHARHDRPTEAFRTASPLKRLLGFPRRIAGGVRRRARQVLLEARLIKGRPDENAAILKRIAAESSACEIRSDAQRILFLTVRGWRIHLAFESLVAARLRQLGHDVAFLHCSDSLPFCMMNSVNVEEPDRRDCESCCATKGYLPGNIFPSRIMAPTGTLPKEVVELIGRLSLEECRRFSYEGVPYGELCLPGLVWFLRRSRLTEDDTSFYRSAIVSAHLVRCGIEREIATRRPDSVVMINGDFGAERVAGFVLKQLGVRYIAHDFSYPALGNTRLAMAVNSSVWDALTFDQTSRANPPTVSDSERNLAEELLTAWRAAGGYQGDLFWSRFKAVNQSLSEQLGLDSRPIVAAFTNMTFESSVTNKNRAFRDQFQWTEALATFARARPEYQFVVRVHPAENRKGHWRPNESLYRYIMDALQPVPANFKIISPDDSVDSYALGMLSRVVLVYSSTIGIELAERGKRVITAAHVHFAGRGFTIDPENPDDYFTAIDKYMTGDFPTTPDEHRRLVDYVAWFMFRRLTHFEALADLRETWPRVTVRNLSELKSDRLQGVQDVCRLITGERQWW